MVCKEDVRRKLLKRRVSQNPEEKREKDGQIRERLSSLPEFAKAGSLLLYYPIKGEPDLTPLFYAIISEGRRLILPKVSGNDMRLITVEDPSQLRKGAYGIPEPSSGQETEPSDVDLAVVPGIAFDRKGYRVGFGKGYYDRLLKKVSAPKVGVAYSFQVLESVPRDEWDEPVDVVVTENEVIRRL